MGDEGRGGGVSEVCRGSKGTNDVQYCHIYVHTISQLVVYIGKF